MWCLHGLAAQTDRPSLAKSQLEATLYDSTCVQPALVSASMYQTQQLQKCWEKEKEEKRKGLPPAPPVIGSMQLNYGRGSASQPQAADSHPQSQSKPYPSYHQQQREAQLSAGHRRSGQCQEELSTSTPQQEPGHTVGRDSVTDESWEKRCRVERTHGQAAAFESTELPNEELQQDSAVQHVPPAADLRKEQHRTRPGPMMREHRDSRVSNNKTCI